MWIELADTGIGIMVINLKKTHHVVSDHMYFG